MPEADKIYCLGVSIHISSLVIEEKWVKTRQLSLLRTPERHPNRLDRWFESQNSGTFSNKTRCDPKGCFEVIPNK